MNRIFKTVWNRVRRCYVAVNETVTGAKQSSGKGVIATSVIVASLAGMPSCGNALAIYEDINAYVQGYETEQDTSEIVTRERTEYFGNVTVSGHGNTGNPHAGDGYATYAGDSAWISAGNGHTLVFHGNVTLKPSPRDANGYYGSFTPIEAGYETYNGWSTGTVVFEENSILEMQCGGNRYDGNGDAIYVNRNSHLWLKGKISPKSYWRNTGPIVVDSGSHLHAKAEHLLKPGKPGQATRLNAIHNNAFTGFTSNNYKTGASYIKTGYIQRYGISNYVTTPVSYDIIDYSADSLIAKHIIDHYGTFYLTKENITFSGTNKGGLPGADTVFNVATVNALTNEGYRDYIYYDMDLVGEGKTISLGASGSGNLIESGGFKTISNANGATVDGAKTLTLIGTGTVNASLMNGTVSLRNGTLQLGHALVTSGGKLSRVTTGTNSALRVANGNFSIDNLDVVNGAQATINNGSSLAVGHLNSKGTLNVGGTLKAGNGSVLNGVAFAGGTGCALSGTAQLNTFTGNGWVGADSNAHLNVNTDQAISLRNNGGEVFSDHVITLTGNSSNYGLLTARKDLSVVGTVANDNGTVDIKQGFVLGSNSQFNNGTGTVKTVFGNLFDNGTDAIPNGLHTISRQAIVPQEIRETLTDLFTKYVPGSVKEDVLAHMTFNGAGKVVITNANLTTTQRDDLVKAFKEKIVAL